MATDNESKRTTSRRRRPRPAAGKDWDRERYRAQIEQMLRDVNNETFNSSRKVRVIPYPESKDLADTRFLHREDTILTRDSTAAEVRRILGIAAPRRPGRRPDPRLPAQIRGLTVLTVPKGETAVSAVQAVNAVLGRGVATLDRVLHLTSSSACPATEPIPASGVPVPGISRHRKLGRGVKVAVIDTGLHASTRALAPEHWLEGVDGGLEPASIAGHYVGHGEFVAGVLRTMAPSAEVYVHPFFFTSGGVIESDLAPLLVHALATSPDIISMSAGIDLSPEGLADLNSTAQVDDLSDALISLEAFYEEHLKCSATLLVCAAGNDGNRGPFAPASTCWAVAVGALDAQGRRADYSNRGPWVDVYARGSDMVNAYPDGSYTYTEDEGLIGSTAYFTHGLARWSGTSFSTPLVAGLVAARMSWSGEPPREAWEQLLANARVRRGMRVLRPGDADRGVNPPRVWRG
ncbi:S8/S53 family peptidase [Terrabacter sp. Soil810]|uniref:S8 family peptidase n=1 Tax=Terrabacter sp. Soil810 TaxID=1736418 RepID=UPI00070D591E|nr:S8/S53 family peptidase [Terrabacter sp. Soil810]KRF38179.1 hypothetical protein ASG96_17070 [Terrabacter sp. Soil810]